MLICRRHLPKLIDLPSALVKSHSEFPVFYTFIEPTLQRHSARYLNFNFDGHFDDRYNPIMVHLVTVVVRQAIPVGYLGKNKQLSQSTEVILRAAIYTHFHKLNVVHHGLARNGDYQSYRQRGSLVARN